VTINAPGSTRLGSTRLGSTRRDVSIYAYAASAAYEDFQIC